MRVVRSAGTLFRRVNGQDWLDGLMGSMKKIEERIAPRLTGTTTGCCYSHCCQELVCARNVVTCA